MAKGSFLGVHLVGSLPHRDGSEAFRWIGECMGQWVRRVPDETGERAGFIFTQASAFYDNPTLEVIPEDEVGNLVFTQRVRIPKGLTKADVRFEPFGYVDAARASYELFEKLEHQTSCRPIPGSSSPCRRR